MMKTDTKLIRSILEGKSCPSDMNEVLLNLLDEFERKQETIDNAIEVEKIYRKRIALLEQVSQDQALTISQNDYAYTIDKLSYQNEIDFWRMKFEKAREELIEARIAELEAERNYLDARLADFERLAEEFVQFKAPDHMCRMRFIHLLNMGKWRQR